MAQQTPSALELDAIRAQFPALWQTIHEKPLVYLDNAATTQKPQCVLDALVRSYTQGNANVHRGVHHLSQVATASHEEARAYVARFLGASSADEVVFTRGTTESINLVASTFCPTFMKEGDEVILTLMEHHSNIVPWQLQAEALGIKLVVVPITPSGELDRDAYRKAFSTRTRIVSVCHSSNVLGTINPIQELATIAHEHGVPICVDGAQAIAHRAVDVQALGVDFYAFSGHKIYAPTGIGVLYGKREWLEKLPPYQGGGEMIEQVSFAGTTYNALPYKYEAGTPNFIGSVALQTALEYVSHIGMPAIEQHEHALLEYAAERLGEIKGIKIHGTAPSKEPVVSFTLERVHPYDLGTLLDEYGIALRTGHHCAQPLMQHLGVEGTLRVSFALYNTPSEIDAFVNAMQKVLPLVTQA